MARVSGLVSGLDTDALIQELVSAYQKKQDTYVKKQTKLEWTQDVWKGLNSKVYNFYTTTLRNARFSSAYNLKKSTVSDSTKATVTASSNAVVGTQTLNIKQLAKTAYLTGGKLKRAFKSEKIAGDIASEAEGSSKLKELGFTGSGTIKVNVNGKTPEQISINEETTIDDFVESLKEAGLTVNFDKTDQRLFVSGDGKGFSITADDDNSKEALKILGMSKAAVSNSKLSGKSTLKELGFADSGSIKVNVNGKETQISINGDNTINQFVVKLKEAGLTASFDETNQRLFVSASGSGADKEFSITAADENGKEVLDALGMNAVSISDVKAYQKKANINVQQMTDTAYANYVLSQANKNLNTKLSELKDQYKYVTDEKYRQQKEDQWKSQIDGYTAKNEAIDETINNILAWKGEDATAGNGQSVFDFVTENGDGTYSFKADKYLDDDGNLKEDALSADLDKTGMSVSELKQQLTELNANVSQKNTNKALKQSVIDTQTSYQQAQTNDSTGAALDTEIKKLESEIDRNKKLMSKTFDFTNAGGEVEYTDINKNSVTISYADVMTVLNDYAKENLADGETEQAIGDAGLQGPNSYNQIYESYKTAYTNEKVQAEDELKKLDLNASSDEDTIKNKVEAAAANVSSDGAVRVNGQDAEIVLNGATFTSTTNNFSVNGLTITATGEMAPDEKITISTTADIDGMYDSIKSLIKGYNDILKEMNTLYYADSSKGYEPLSDDEKEAMSDTEVEKWEKKIKDSLLRRDDTLSSIMGTIRNSMAKSFNINGKGYSLSTFGINTSGYFAVDNESRGLYHIDGDKDDSSTSGNTDKLRTALASDPDSVIAFFQKLSDDMYTQLTKKMSATSLRSSYTIYNDKQLKKQYEEYDDVIAEWDEKIENYTQKYVKQFTAMETALAKLQSSTSALSSLIG